MGLSPEGPHTLLSADPDKDLTFFNILINSSQKKKKIKRI